MNIQRMSSIELADRIRSSGGSEASKANRPKAMEIDSSIGLTEGSDIAWSAVELLSAAAGEKAGFENEQFRPTAIDLPDIAEYNKLLSPAAARANQVSNTPGGKWGALAASLESDIGRVSGTTTGECT
jgi:hypothetical protein